MNPGPRAVLVGAFTIAVSVLLAFFAPGRVVGGMHELAPFAVWSLPLGGLLAVFASRPRFQRLSGWTGGVASSLSGLLIGVALAMAGWLLVGGWMLAWDFPVLFCWTLAGSFGAVLAAKLSGTIRAWHGAVGVGVALVPLAALAWIGSRPTPGVLIVYRDDPQREVAQLILDSLLTVPHPSGQGRDIRWPHNRYSLVQREGHTAALISLRGAEYRDSIRRVLTGHPMVISVTDTMLPP